MSPTLFARANVIAGTLVVTFLPMLVYWHWIQAGEMNGSDWVLFGVAMGAIQGLFWITPRRCSSKYLGYWNGLTAAAQCMGTGWVYFDLCFSAITLPPLILASFVVAFSQRPAPRFHKLVHFYYIHRMRQ